jgi:hypothetical protein
VRLPDPDESGRVYLDLWDQVKGSRTKDEYLRGCKGAIASIYASWKKDHDDWASVFETMRPGPSPCFCAWLTTGSGLLGSSST